MGIADEKCLLAKGLPPGPLRIKQIKLLFVNSNHVPQSPGVLHSLSHLILGITQAQLYDLPKVKGLVGVRTKAPLHFWVIHKQVLTLL